MRKTGGLKVSSNIAKRSQIILRKVHSGYIFHSSDSNGNVFDTMQVYENLDNLLKGIEDYYK